MCFISTTFPNAPPHPYTFGPVPKSSHGTCLDSHSRFIQDPESKPEREGEREREISIAIFFHSSQIYKLYKTPLTMGNKSSNIAF